MTEFIKSEHTPKQVDTNTVLTLLSNPKIIKLMEGFDTNTVQKFLEILLEIEKVKNEILESSGARKEIPTTPPS